MSRNQLLIDKLHSPVLGNQRITMRELSNGLGLSLGSVLFVWRGDSAMKCVTVKLVPKLLTVESHLLQNFLAKHQIP
jgi:hypothetical protein